MKHLPDDFDMLNTREFFLVKIIKKPPKRFFLLYLVFISYSRQICYTQLSELSSKSRSWGQLLVYVATVIIEIYLIKFKAHYFPAQYIQLMKIVPILHLYSKWSKAIIVINECMFKNTWCIKLNNHIIFFTTSIPLTYDRHHRHRSHESECLLVNN